MSNLVVVFLGNLNCRFLKYNNNVLTMPYGFVFSVFLNHKFNVNMTNENCQQIVVITSMGYDL